MDQNNPIISFIPMILIMGIMYFLMIRPQMQKEKERKAKIAALAKGSKVIASGIYGDVISTDETSVLLQVDDKVKIRFDKSVVQPL